MTRPRFGKPAAPSTANPCFCGCGAVAVWGGPPGAHYLPGHAPHERPPAPAPRRVEAGAVPPVTKRGQGDLFGAPAPRSRTGP